MSIGGPSLAVSVVGRRSRAGPPGCSQANFRGGG